MNFGPTFFYGALSLIVVLAAIASGRQPLRLASLALLADWMAWNTVIISFGFTYAPLILPVGDSMFLGFTVWIWRDTFPKSDTVAMVAYLFLVAILAWATFGLTGMQNSYLCYLTANLIFLLQLVVLGASSAWRAITDRVGSVSGAGALRAMRGSGAGRVHGVGGAPHQGGS